MYKKENPDFSQNWPQEKLLKLTGRKSVLKTVFWAVFRPDFPPLFFFFKSDMMVVNIMVGGGHPKAGPKSQIKHGTIP